MLVKHCHWFLRSHPLFQLSVERLWRLYAVESLMFVSCSLATFLQHQKEEFPPPGSCVLSSLRAVSSPLLSVMAHLIYQHSSHSHTPRRHSDHIEPSLFWGAQHASFWPLMTVMCFSFCLGHSSVIMRPCSLWRLFH